eukprot:1296381-Prymnesium_polylepis.2
MSMHLQRRGRWREAAGYFDWNTDGTSCALPVERTVIGGDLQACVANKTRLGHEPQAGHVRRQHTSRQVAGPKQCDVIYFGPIVNGARVNLDPHHVDFERVLAQLRAKHAIAFRMHILVVA